MTWLVLQVSDIKIDNYHNGIILPENCLRELLDKQFIFPKDGLKLRLYSEDNHFELYVHVIEFSAPDDHIIIPRWMCDFYNLDEQYLEIDILSNVLKGKSITIQPQEESFFDIFEYEDCLEQTLSSYSMLRQNETIVLNMYGVEYHFLIKEIGVDEDSYYEQKEELEETKDDELDNIDNIDYIEPYNVICIINTDITTDIHNKFIEAELIRKREEEILERTRKQSEKNRKQKEKLERELMSHEDELSYELNHKLGGETKELSKEELRQKRLAIFG